MAREEIKRLFEAARRGIAWIVAQQRADGSFCDSEDGVGGYYKVPFALALAGHQREALHLVQWVGEHHLTAEGDFRAPQRKAHEAAHDRWPIYSNAWLVQGAHRLGRWDVSLRGAEFLLRYQVPSGGFYALDGQTRFLEPVCTSWGGLAALATGHAGAARRAGDLLVRLVRDQPNPQRFYFRMDTEGGLITDVPDGEELSHYVDATRLRQIYYNPGITLIFLTNLYRATGKERYLSASEEILRFTERCAEDVYGFPPSGKLGSGCALLYAITGSQEARRAAGRVGDYLAETQTQEGFWRLPDEEPYSSLSDRDGFEIWLDIPAEFSAFLLEIASRI